MDQFRMAEIGCAEVDDQHREIELAIAKLSNAVFRRASLDEVLAEFRAMVHLVRTHFADEEVIFDAAKVSMRERHRAEHARLLAALDDLGQRLTDNREVSMRSVLDVADQIAQHVYSFDMTYRGAADRETR